MEGRDLGSGLTDECNPAVSDLTYGTAVSEVLDEQGKCEITPSIDEVPQQHPKEYCNCPTSVTDRDMRQDEESIMLG